MPICVQCLGCGKTVTGGDDRDGTWGECPDCKTTVYFSKYDDFTSLPINSPIGSNAEQTTPFVPSSTKICPYCAGEVKVVAKKCKHCGEFLDYALRANTSGSFGVGSMFLSGYAILFAGLAPLGLAAVALTHGVGIHLLINVFLSIAILYFGVRVFAGNYSAVKVFAILVILHYLGVAMTNIWIGLDLPAGSLEAAVPRRILRGVVFAAIYAWYYLFRSKTAEISDHATRTAVDPPATRAA